MLSVHRTRHGDGSIGLQGGGCLGTSFFVGLAQLIQVTLVLGAHGTWRRDSSIKPQLLRAAGCWLLV